MRNFLQRVFSININWNLFWDVPNITFRLFKSALNFGTLPAIRDVTLVVRIFFPKIIGQIEAKKNERSRGRISLQECEGPRVV